MTAGGKRLVELFRRAMPAYEALWYDASHDKCRMTTEQHAAACAVVHEFEKATACNSALDPEMGGPGSLRDALIAECERPVTPDGVAA